MAKLYLKYKESEIPILIHAILCIAAYILWILLILIILPFFLIFQIIRFACYVMTCCFDDGKPLELSDIPFVLDCELNPYIIVGFIKIKGKISADELKKLFKERILEPFRDSYHLKKLREYVTCSYNTYVWKSAHFDLANHIYDADNLIEGTPEELKIIFQNMTQEQFNKNHAPWKIIIYSTTDGKTSYMFSAVHHAVGDGFSLQALFTYLYDKKPTFITPSKNQGVLSNIYERIMHGILTGPLVLTTIIFSKFYENPFYLTNINNKEKRCFAWENIPFDSIKDIKNKTSTTVNDVLLAALSRALAKYLNNKSIIYELPIVITFNSRSYKDLTQKAHQLKNQSGGSFMSLPLNKEYLHTLDIINRRTKILKNSSDGHTFEFIFSKIIGLLPSYMAKLAATSLREHCSLVVSNVPGPLDTIWINGHKVDSLVTSPPLMYDLGVSVGFLTYSNNLCVSVLSRESVLPDPDLLVSYYKDELSNMHQLIKEKIE